MTVASRSFSLHPPQGLQKSHLRFWQKSWLSILRVLPIVVFSLPAALGAEFTLEDILGSPFPSQLVASADTPKVAWVFNHKGGRDIWVAEGPGYVGRPVTELTADDGQEITSLDWSPDGQWIAYVRGGAPNSKDELPNPMLEPAGVERAVYIVRLDGGRERRVDDGSSPLFLSDRSLLYLKSGEIRVARMLEGGEIETHALVGGRGSFGSLTLSPDGRRLAFVSDRGSHSFVGVYDFSTDALTYLDPSVDRDTSPVWSLDGRQVAFVRLPARLATDIFVARREGPPWSIRIATPGASETSRGGEVWRAERGPGSVFRGVVADRQLFWTADNHLVFPWELDGWTHLYALPLTGGAPRLLTPGAAEVDAVSLLADRSGVIYSSNLGDMGRRHLWTVAAAGQPRALTQGQSIEQSPVPTTSGAVAFLTSDGKRPLEPAILVAGQVRRLAPSLVSVAFPREQLVEPRPVVFAAADGMPIHGQLFEPPDEFRGPRPALLFFHGGSRRQMLQGWHFSSYYHNCYAFNQYMASRGFVVLAVNYRSGIGYGLEFREALGYGAGGASEFHDVLGAGLFLRALENVRPEAIGLWGGSYGGYLTALGLARASDLFAAGVDLHGVHDWRRTIKNFVPSYNPLEDPERAQLAFESSPMASLETWRSPVLLVHGDDDRNVPFAESVELAEKLRARGVEVEVLVFPDEVHGFLVHSHWLEVFRRSSEFLIRHLDSSG